MLGQAKPTLLMHSASPLLFLVAVAMLAFPCSGLALWGEDGYTDFAETPGSQSVEAERQEQPDVDIEIARSRLAELQPLPKNERIRVAVSDMAIKVPDAEAFIGAGVTEMLIDVLHETRRYTVIDRAIIADVVGEQDLALAGRMARSSGPRAGRLKGARLWITGAVTEFKNEKSGRGFGIGFAGLGIGIRNTKALVGMELRVIDAETGEVIESATRRAERDSHSTAFTGAQGDMAMNWDIFKESQMGQAARDVVTQLVVFIDEAVTRHHISADFPAWSGRVVKVLEDGRIVINGGSNQDLAKGTRIKIFREHEVFIDPETGESLGAERSQIGVIEITETREKYSYARVIQGGGFATNDAAEQVK
jgi:curli biogenesis system outer membrane secretion channel CsgG